MEPRVQVCRCHTHSSWEPAIHQWSDSKIPEPIAFQLFHRFRPCYFGLEQQGQGYSRFEFGQVEGYIVGADLVVSGRAVFFDFVHP